MLTMINIISLLRIMSWIQKTIIKTIVVKLFSWFPSSYLSNGTCKIVNCVFSSISPSTLNTAVSCDQQFSICNFTFEDLSKKLFKNVWIDFRPHPHLPNNRWISLYATNLIWKLNKVNQCCMQHESSTIIRIFEQWNLDSNTDLYISTSDPIYFKQEHRPWMQYMPFKRLLIFNSHHRAFIYGLKIIWWRL